MANGGKAVLLSPCKVECTQNPIESVFVIQEKRD